jgi:hypothetical protein
MKSLRSGSQRAAIVLLLVVLAAAFAVEGSQPMHSHGDGRLALYNAECPLAELSAVHTAGWAPERLAIASPEPVALPIAVTSSEWVPSPVPSLTDSRAPPLA